MSETTFVSWLRDLPEVSAPSETDSERTKNIRRRMAHVMIDRVLTDYVANWQTHPNAWNRVSAAIDQNYGWSLE